MGFFLTNFNKEIVYRSSQSPKLGEKRVTFAAYFCNTIMKSIIMKKLFTISWPDNVRTHHDYLSQAQGAQVNAVLSQNNSLNSGLYNDYKLSISTRLISFNFFNHSATYTNENPLLLTYSAETTQTYKDKLTASFNFSASVLSGEMSENIIINTGIERFNTCCFTADLFHRKNRMRVDEYGDLYLK